MMILHGSRKGAQYYTNVAWLKYPAIQFCEEENLAEGMRRVAEMLWQATECAMHDAVKDGKLAEYLDEHFYCFPNPGTSSKLADTI